jgi:hypothetical protein
VFSKRVANNECVNSEGKLSVHLSDGANFLYQTGDEVTLNRGERGRERGEERE